MSVIGSDGLSLWVGNGAVNEVFTLFDGAIISRFEIIQRGQIASALASSAWQEVVGTSNRQAIVEVDGYAVEDLPSTRVRALALSGSHGNFKLALSDRETVSFNAVVVQYREDIGAGDIKRIRFRLESSGIPSFA